VADPEILKALEDNVSVPSSFIIEKKRLAEKTVKTNSGEAAAPTTSPFIAPLSQVSWVTNQLNTVLSLSGVWSQCSSIKHKNISEIGT